MGSSRPKAKGDKPAAALMKKVPTTPTVKAEPGSQVTSGITSHSPSLVGTRDSPVKVDSSGEEDYKPVGATKRIAPLAASSSSMAAKTTTRTLKRKHSPADIPHTHGREGAEEWLQVDGQALECSGPDSNTVKPTPGATSSHAALAPAKGPAQPAVDAAAAAATAAAGNSPAKPPSTPNKTPTLFGGPSPIYSTSLSGPALQTPEKTSTFEDLMSSGMSGTPSKKHKAVSMSPSEYRASIAASKLNLSRLSTHGNLIHSVVETTLDLFGHTSEEFLVDLDQYRGVLYPLVTDMVMAMEQKRASLFHSRIRVLDEEKDEEDADDK